MQVFQKIYIWEIDLNIQLYKHSSFFVGKKSIPYNSCVLLKLFSGNKGLKLPLSRITENLSVGAHPTWLYQLVNYYTYVEF